MSGLTIDNPVTFAEAITSPRVIPGDVLKLLPGTYTATRQGLFSGSDAPGKGVFRVALRGTQVAPIIIEPQTKGTVRINGGLELSDSQYVTVRDLEIAPTPTVRNAPRDQIDYPFCVYCSSLGCSFTGNYLHDGREGFAIYNAGGCNVRDNIVLNIGWIEEDGGHGAGIYTHNHPGGTFTIRNNVFHSFGDHAINLWSQSNNAVQDYQCLENVALFGRLFCGCESGVCANNTIDDNHIWKAALRLGRPSALNGLILARRNRVYAVGSALLLWWQRLAIVINNRFYNDSSAIASYVAPAAGESNTVDANEYFGNGVNIGVHDDGLDTNLSWEQWAAKGYDSHSDMSVILPTTNEVSIYDNLLVIWNWEGLDSVPVDLPIGTTLINAQDPTDTQIFADSVDMTGRTVAAPVGTGLTTPVSTFPLFGAFVIA